MLLFHRLQIRRPLCRCCCLVAAHQMFFWYPFSSLSSLSSLWLSSSVCLTVQRGAVLCGAVRCCAAQRGTERCCTVLWGAVRCALRDAPYTECGVRGAVLCCVVMLYFQGSRSLRSRPKLGRKEQVATADAKLYPSCSLSCFDGKDAVGEREEGG